jgi:hypothetical protein
MIEFLCENPKSIETRNKKALAGINDQFNNICHERNSWKDSLQPGNGKGRLSYKGAFYHVHIAVFVIV